MNAAETRAWRRNLRWIAALLAIWFTVTFVVAWFARDLRFNFFGWPFSFWVGAQGALVVYVLMAALYAWRMNRADAEDESMHRSMPGPAVKDAAPRPVSAPAATPDPTGDTAPVAPAMSRPSGGDAA